MSKNRFPRDANPDWYRVSDWRMETTCQWCGIPLVVGDRALEVFAHVYCSELCATHSHRTLLTEAKD